MLCRACFRARAARTLANVERPRFLALRTLATLQSSVRSDPTTSARSARQEESLFHPAQALRAGQQRIFGRRYSSTSTAPASATSNPPATTNGATPSSGPEKPDYLDAAESKIWDRLMSAFAPSELVVQDISGGCGSMYGIEIASERFRGVGMLAQQRLVNAELKDLMQGWHGVQLKTRVP